MSTCVAGELRGRHSGYSQRKCRCDECSSAAREYGRKYRANNKDVNSAERQRKYRAAHPEKRESPEQLAERKARARAADPEKFRARARQWHRDNPASSRAASVNRRAHKRGAFVERVIPQQVYKRDAWTCHICDGKINKRMQWPQPYSASIDHIVALANGGLHSYDNIAAAHLRCNLSKGVQ